MNECGSHLFATRVKASLTRICGIEKDFPNQLFGSNITGAIFHGEPDQIISIQFTPEKRIQGIFDFCYHWYIFGKPGGFELGHTIQTDLSVKAFKLNELFFFSQSHPSRFCPLYYGKGDAIA